MLRRVVQGSLLPSCKACNLRIKLKLTTAKKLSLVGLACSMYLIHVHVFYNGGHIINGMLTDIGKVHKTNAAVRPPILLQDTKQMPHFPAKRKKTIYLNFCAYYVEGGIVI